MYPKFLKNMTLGGEIEYIEIQMSLFHKMLNILLNHGYLTLHKNILITELLHFHYVFRG